MAGSSGNARDNAKPATRKRSAAAAAAAAATSSSSSPPSSSAAATLDGGPLTKEMRYAPPERRAAAMASKSWQKPAKQPQTSPRGGTAAAAAAASANASATTTTPATPGSAGSHISEKAATDKSQRGLRHFSMMVCKKVEEKKTTTYNEVADELVKKVVADRRKHNPNAKLDEKNIRRRVYDALNVLMAMDIISKDKKEITWKGLPSSVRADVELLEREREFRKAQVERKREALRELLVQQVCFRNLVQHNHRRAEAAVVSAAASAGGSGGGSGSGGMDQAVAAAAGSGKSGANNNNNPTSDERIPLPFIVVNTHSSAVIQCEMSPDREEVMFDFSMPFEINDDNSILKRLGMHKSNMRVLREMLPDDLLSYCQHNGLLDSILDGNNRENDDNDDDDDDDDQGQSPSLSAEFMVSSVARLPSPQES